MAKRQHKQNFIEKYQILIAVGVLLVAGYYGISTGFIKIPPFNFVLPFSPTPQAPLNPPTQLYSYNLSITITPNPVCVGQNLTGTITSNIPNGVCSIFYNPGTGFTLLSNANLNAVGYYSVTDHLDVAGTAIFRVVCCDAQGNCRISNDASITSTFAIPPCLPAAGPDSDGDGYSDDAENAAGTNPNDINDYPGHHGVNSCVAICSAKGFVGARTVNSASECVGTEVFEASGNTYCCCTPASEQNPNLCDGAIIPSNVGDKGGYCAALTGCQPFNGTPKVCDNYYNSVLQQHKCGCVMTFWCQENYFYNMNPSQCVCPPHTFQEINAGQFRCVPIQ